MALDVRENISLKEYTTFKTGGVARYFVEVKTEEEVIEAGHFAKQNDLPLLIICGGSNLLVSDEGFAGLVMINSLKGSKYLEGEDDSVLLEVASGEVFDEVVAESVSRGYWGLENLSAIPGTVGATPVQNVGAYGCEIGDLILQVEAINLYTNNKKIFTNSQCKFGYRESIFKTEEGNNFFITKVFLKLSKEVSPKLSYADLKKQFVDYIPTLPEIRNSIIVIRSKKFPDWKVVGTAGSFFKNPIITSKQADELLAVYPEVPVYHTGAGMVKIPLGYLLDKVCGLKGYRQGKVGLYKEQALVLVNYGDATTNEIKNFANEISEIVFAKTKINISPEVRFIEKL